MVLLRVFVTGILENKKAQLSQWVTGPQPSVYGINGNKLRQKNSKQNKDKLTAPLVQELIDRIDVYEVTGTGKNRKQQIKIHWGIWNCQALGAGATTEKKPARALP